jgi:hypothetical protein
MKISGMKSLMMAALLVVVTLSANGQQKFRLEVSVG